MLEFLRFYKFSRNRLAGDEPPPGDSSIMHYFGVLEREPPGGTLPAARRRLGLFQFLGLWMKRLAGLVESLGGAKHFFDFGFFLGSGLNVIEAKVSGGTVKGIILLTVGMDTGLN